MKKPSLSFLALASASPPSSSLFFFFFGSPLLVAPFETNLLFASIQRSSTHHHLRDSFLLSKSLSALIATTLHPSPKKEKTKKQTGLTLVALPQQLFFKNYHTNTHKKDTSAKPN
jgi:hypothetical protein